MFIWLFSFLLFPFFSFFLFLVGIERWIKNTFTRFRRKFRMLRINVSPVNISFFSALNNFFCYPPRMITRDQMNPNGRFEGTLYNTKKKEATNWFWRKITSQQLRSELRNTSCLPSILITLIHSPFLFPLLSFLQIISQQSNKYSTYLRLLFSFLSASKLKIEKKKKKKEREKKTEIQRDKDTVFNATVHAFNRGKA